MSNSNLFFERNTIKNITAQIPPNTHSRSKRALSVANLKLNPGKFLHREVFDNRLYDKTSYFKLEIPEEKERERDKIWQAPRDLQKTVSRLGEILDDDGITQQLSNFGNHCSLMLRNEVKKQFIDSLTQILLSLLKRMHQKIEKIAITQRQLQQKVREFQLSATMSKMCQTGGLEQSRRQTKKQQKDKRLQQKNNHLDFNLKREILKVNQLQQKLKQQEKANGELREKIGVMQKEQDAQSSYKQAMEYKVKRLKEELEVAHIIKEQNLADKMKYIMNW